MNCLIDKTGKTVDCRGGVHDIVCRQRLKMTLSKFFKFGGIRVMVRSDTVAVEHYKPMTDKQNKIINKLLKQQPIYVIVTEQKTITKLRPIRNFDFNDSLVSK